MPDKLEKINLRDDRFKVEKINKEQQLVFGWFSVVEKNGEPLVDREGSVITPVELEKAAYDFVLHARIAGENHIRKGVGDLVESIMFTKEKQELLGIDLGKVGWFGGFKVTDASVWKAVTEGEYAMFSIGGKGTRVEME